MPVSSIGVASNKVKRTPSIQSEQSSLSVGSDSRRVNFNPDVRIKRIPKQTTKPKAQIVDPNDEFSGKFDDYAHDAPPSSQEEIANEAEAILRQLQEIQCSVSPTPVSVPNSKPGTLEKRKRGLGSSLTNLVTTGRLSKSSSDLVNDRNGLNKVRAMRVDGYSEQDDSSSPPPHDHRFYGLQALSNLDNAVNGKINNFTINQDSSGSTDYSPPPKKNNYTPPKPPRKAPSSSPPNIRRGYVSYDELDQPSRNGDIRYERKMENNAPFSYTGANPTLSRLSKSPGRFSPSTRMSPSRGNHTDSEILNSPTQVLYATISADKYRNTNSVNQHIVNSSSQTSNTGFRPVQPPQEPKSRTSSRASSRENILEEPIYRYNNGTTNNSAKHVTRSLERFVDDDKENLRNELRARIHVTSPDRYTPERQNPPVSRKPYKTTINTATDTIQYRGFSTENLHGQNKHRQMYNKEHNGRRQDTEHYKVPKNKAPVPADFRSRNGMRTDTDSPAYNNGHAHHGHPPHLEKKSNLRSPFASTRLVKNVESRGKQPKGSPTREYDREGRRIVKRERSRAYSGYSTSPDREVSPERYAKPRVNSKLNLTHRSPSSSPTRPPRMRGSPTREHHIQVRREHTGREVDRSPSTRAAATSKSPIKKIQQVHNDIRGDKQEHIIERAVSVSPQRPVRTNTLNRDRDGGVRKVKTLLNYKNKPKANDEDRLSKFTEYRGGQPTPDPILVNGRRTPDHVNGRRTPDQVNGRRTPDQTGRRGSHSVGTETMRRERESHMERERGQSVPPGANIDSMRDFYKSNQYKSMYNLPPSPSRPAPVLDRGTKPQTLERSTLQRERSTEQITSRPRRLAKSSVSEGELTDDQMKQDRVNRQRNKFLNNIISRQGDQQVKRVMSSDREKEAGKTARNGELNNRRTTSHEPKPRRQAPQPPPLQKVRRSSVDVLDSSHSASDNEAPNAEKPEKLNGEGRWANGQSDIDADYRRELATSTNNINSVHMEARGRDGGAPPNIYQQAATLGRNQAQSTSKTKIDRVGRGKSGERGMREVEISQDDEEDEMMRSPTTMSREEERRKIIELEEDRRKKEIGVVGAQRSGSRVTKLMGGRLRPSKSLDTENESQYSGHSSSSMRKEPSAPKGRYTPNSNIRVKRTPSNATSTGGARIAINRKKMPGSLTSSINSSESEHGSQGSHAGQSGVSRGTNLSASSNRSVYLHATAVADIPSSKEKNVGDSKENPNSNLQKSKKISRSISLLAPWKGKGTKQPTELNYDNQQAVYGTAAAKPPRPPPQGRRVQSGQNMTREKKFASSSDLLRDENEIVMAAPETQTMPRKPTAKVSRSVSMPKDTRLAGWFKKRKRV